MKHTQSNLIYHTEFDGTIFKYRLKGFFRVLLPLLGFGKRFESPLNIVLGYKLKRNFLAFEYLRFAIYRHKYRNKAKLETLDSAPLFFMSSNRSGFTRLLRKAIEENIKETKEGNNMGLLQIPMEIIRSHYSATRLTSKAGSKTNQSKELKISSRDQIIPGFVE